MSPPDIRTGRGGARTAVARRPEAATQARTPRSGGRTTAQRQGMKRPGITGRAGYADPAGGRAGHTYPARDGGVRAFPTDGSAALAAAADRPAANTGARLRVAPPVPVTVPRAPFVVLVLMVVVGGVLGILLLNTKINENAFHLHDLRAQQAVLDQRQEQLEQQIAEAESPGTLAAAARRLGQVAAGEPAFLRLPEGTVVGVPVPATGTPSRTSQQAGG